VLDTSVQMDTAAGAGVALDRCARVDDLELLLIGGDFHIVTARHRDLREDNSLRLPALGAAADVVVCDIPLDADGHRRGGAFAGERAAGEIGRAGLDAAIDGRMYR